MKLTLQALLGLLLLVCCVESQYRRLVRTKAGPGTRRRVKKVKIFPTIEKHQERERDQPLQTEAASERLLNPFSLFNLVRFPNTACTTDRGSDGVCYTNSECRRRGGEPSGSCAGGFGACCTFVSECNSETSQNGTMFSSPSSLSSVCSLMIKPMHDNICQIRLDLEEFVLAEPDISGVCRTDYMQVTGGVANSGGIPTVCGSNSGQHLIYSAIPNFPARLSVVVDNQVAFSRQWKIRITQYTCDSVERAPEGCLQYLTGISGNVSSFNWKLQDNMNGQSFSNHLSNLRYNVCVRRESGYCSIEWGVGTSFENSTGYFSMSGALPTSTGNPVTVTSTDVDIGDAECREDFLNIPGGWGGTDPNNALFTRDRYCGQAFGYCTKDDCTTREIGTVRSYQTPFTLGVVTDNDENQSSTSSSSTTDTQNRGFRLFYRQNPCS